LRIHPRSSIHSSSRFGQDEPDGSLRIVEGMSLDLVFGALGARQAILEDKACDADFIEPFGILIIDIRTVSPRRPASDHAIATSACGLGISYLNIATCWPWLCRPRHRISGRGALIGLIPG